MILMILISLAVVMCQGCERSTAAAAQGKGPRIVALSPAAGIILRDLGRESQIVGRHGYDDFLPREVPTCGDQAGIDFERLLGVEPTHIVTQWGRRDYPARLRELAIERGWVLLDVPLMTLADIEEGARQVDAALGAPPEGSAEYAVLRERMGEAWRKKDGMEHAGRVLLLASTNPPAAFGPGSCHHDILLRLGAIPAVTEGAAYIEMDAEDVLRCAPDTIVLVLPRSRGRPASPDARAALGSLSGLGLAAVKAGRVVLIDDPACQIPSTSMIRFAEALAEGLQRVAR